jgi:hypothetical protein
MDTYLNISLQSHVPDYNLFCSAKYHSKILASAPNLQHLTKEFKVSVPHKFIRNVMNFVHS